jgi:Ankyrin repeats (3 copies)/Ankyrin repeat
MTNLFDVAKEGNLERVMLLVEQGAEKDKIFGNLKQTALITAAEHGREDVVRYLVQQGADMEKACDSGATPLIYASWKGHLDVARYFLEQGANRDKATASCRYTSLHLAALEGHLDIVKLLMVYGADLNARTNNGQLPIDMGNHNTEEIRQAIRDEPRRRIDEAPGKRATDEDRHPNAATSASTQQEDVEEIDEQINKKPRLDEGAKAEEGKVAEEDEDSEPSSDEEEKGN